MQTSFRLFSFRAVPVFAFLAAFCAVRPASADFLYNITTNAFGVATHEQFTEPAILTSSTTVSSFLLNTSTGPAVTSVVLDPVASGVCSTGTITGSGPCLGLNLANGNSTFFSGLPVYTSIGTFVGPGGGPTITISPFVASTPEPASVLLLMTMLGGAVFAWKKRLKSPTATAYPK